MGPRKLVATQQEGIKAMSRNTIGQTRDRISYLAGKLGAKEYRPGYPYKNLGLYRANGCAFLTVTEADGTGRDQIGTARNLQEINFVLDGLELLS